jgi:LacI family transcriptional regulator
MATPNVITLNRVADRAGVSISTVSRVLSGKARSYRITKKTEDTVRKAAEELNYVPNFIAMSLRLKRTNSIGLIIPDISNQFFASIARSIEIESRKMKYSIILCDTQENTELEIESIAVLLRRKVDGLLICPVGIEYNHIKKISEKKIPVVIIDRYMAGLDFPSFVSDNYRGAFEAIEYLVGNGHRKIAFIQGLVGTTVNNDRVKGYVDSLNKNGIPLNNNHIVGDSFGIENGYISTKLLLSLSDRPTAIFSVSNLASLGVLRALQEENLKVPDDISIISFDDQIYSDFLATPLTTIKQPQTEMGRVACKFLINQIEFDSKYPNKTIVFPNKLIIRKSVKRI